MFSNLTFAEDWDSIGNTESSDFIALLYSYLCISLVKPFFIWFFAACNLTNQGLICSSTHSVRIMLHLGKANDTDGKSQDFQQDSVILGPRPREASRIGMIIGTLAYYGILWHTMAISRCSDDKPFCGSTCTHLGTESESDEPLWDRFLVTCSRLCHYNVVATLCCDNYHHL